MTKQFNKTKTEITSINNNSLSASVAQSIKEALCCNKITLENFAFAMQAPTAEVENWLSGKFNFSLHLISKIEDKLKIKLIKLNTQPHSTKAHQHQAVSNYATQCKNYHRIFLHLIGRLESSI